MDQIKDKNLLRILCTSMHQLGVKVGHDLNGETLAEEVKKLLEPQKSGEVKMFKDKAVLGGAIAAAFAASLCCIAPLLFVLLGVGSLGMAAIFEPARPYLMCGAVLLLVLPITGLISGTKSPQNALRTNRARQNRQAAPLASAYGLRLLL